MSGVTGAEPSLVWPAEWKREIGRGKFYPTLIIGFAAFIGISGLMLLAQGKLAGAFIVLVIAVGAGLTGAARWPRKLRGAFTTDSVVVNGMLENGVLIPMRVSRTAGAGLAVLCLPFIGFGAWGAVIAFRGREWWPMLFCAFLFVLGVFFLFGAIGTVRTSRQQARGILLTPQRVVLTYGEKLDLEWSEIAHVDARTLGVNVEIIPRTVMNLIVFVVHDIRRVEELPRQFRALGHRVGANAVGTIAVDRLTVDPVRVLYAMRFYLAHPESRAELGTSAAVHRITRGAF